MVNPVFAHFPVVYTYVLRKLVKNVLCLDFFSICVSCYVVFIWLDLDVFDLVRFDFVKEEVCLCLGFQGELGVKFRSF